MSVNQKNRSKSKSTAFVLYLLVVHGSRSVTGTLGSARVRSRQNEGTAGVLVNLLLVVSSYVGAMSNPFSSLAATTEDAMETGAQQFENRLHAYYI